MAEKRKENDAADDIKMLDELIKKTYDELKQAEHINPKIGDFIKMVETRRKLAPIDAEQKKFWSMLEEIRKEKLGDNKTQKVRKRKAVKK